MLCVHNTIPNLFEKVWLVNFFFLKKKWNFDGSNDNLFSNLSYGWKHYIYSCTLTTKVWNGMKNKINNIKNVIQTDWFLFSHFNLLVTDNTGFLQEPVAKLKNLLDVQSIIWGAIKIVLCLITEKKWFYVEDSTLNFNLSPCDCFKLVQLFVNV